MGLTVCDGSAAAENNYLVELDHTTATRCYELSDRPKGAPGSDLRVASRPSSRQCSGATEAQRRHGVEEMKR
jgi:hypothetical protein